MSSEITPRVDVLSPKGPARPVDLRAWARAQLRLAGQLMDDPGGGLLSATQAMGQVRAALQESGDERWAETVPLLREAEDAAVHRDFALSRDHLEKIGAALA